jgi:predicted transcriptional regulator YdeE
VRLKGFSVVGISGRTSNAREMTSSGVIPGVWKRFFEERVPAKIPNRADQNLLAVYTDYESDKDGAYTYVLGAKVTSAFDVPQGMVAVKVPAGKYAVITTAEGPAAKVVPEAWRRIWSMYAPKLGGQRAYRTDFELYDERASDPKNSQVEIYIGLR